MPSCWVRKRSEAITAASCSATELGYVLQTQVVKQHRSLRLKLPLSRQPAALRLLRQALTAQQLTRQRQYASSSAYSLLCACSPSCQSKCTANLFLMAAVPYMMQLSSSHALPTE